MTKNQIFYSPAENHLAVIYSDRHGLKRFKRFATENERVVLVPRRITCIFVLKEINLGPRTAHLHFSNVFSKDRVPLELELKVFFRFDPRKANEDNFIQVINSQNQALEGIIKTNIEKIIRNEVFVSQTAEDILFSPRAKRHIQSLLSARIAKRAKNFGLTINDEFGASIMNMQPNKIYMKALSEEAAANAQGRAAAKRLVESVKNSQGMTPEEALLLVYTQIASAVAKTGNMPEYVVHNNNVGEQTPDQGFYRKAPPKKPSPKIPSPERSLPLVE